MDIPSEHKENLLYCEGDWAVAQVAQRGCGVFIPGDAEKPSGHGPEEPAVDGLAWAGAARPDDLQRSLPTSTNLWFCEKSSWVYGDFLLKYQLFFGLFLSLDKSYHPLVPSFPDLQMGYNYTYFPGRHTSLAVQSTHVQKTYALFKPLSGA